MASGGESCGQRPEPPPKPTVPGGGSFQVQEQWGRAGLGVGPGEREGLQSACVVTRAACVSALPHGLGCWAAGPVSPSLDLQAHGECLLDTRLHHGRGDGGCPSWAPGGLWRGVHSLSQLCL